MTATSNNCSNPTIFDALAQLLHFKEYRPALMPGFVTSAGGVTEHTSKAAQRALLHQLREAEDKEGGGKSEFATDVCSEILCILQRIGVRDQDPEVKRVLTPVLNTTGLLLANGIFPALLAPTLLESTSKAVRKSGDIGRLRASVAVFIGLLKWPGQLRRQTLSALLQLLGCSFPVVRQATAQAFYIRLLEEDEGGLDLSQEVAGAAESAAVQPFDPPGRGNNTMGEPVCEEMTEAKPALAGEALAETLELLSTTPWGTDSNEVLTEALGRVHLHLGIVMPADVYSSVGPKKSSEPRQRKPEYATLVRDNHY